MNSVAWKMFRPISSKAAAFDTSPEASASTDTPVRCPVAFIASSSLPAFSAPSPKAARAFCVLSTALVTSVSLRLANWMNCVLSASSSSPVTPKRVFTSPIALPAVAKSVGIVVAIDSMMAPISSAAAPVAPVFLMIVSRPSSTSPNAARDATPTAASGAVTFFVIPSPKPLILSPASLTFSPTALTDSAAASNCCLATEPKLFASSWSRFSSFSSSMI